MNLIGYDVLINYFTNLSQKYFKEADKREDRYDNYSLGKATAYREVVHILTKLKNKGDFTPMSKELDLFDKIYEAYEACIAKHLVSMEDYVNMKDIVSKDEVSDEKEVSIAENEKI